MKQLNQNFKISKIDALQQLAESSHEFVQLFTRNSLQIEMYKPDKIDRQHPHNRDEVYIIVSGKGSFFHEGEIVEVAASDCLFVAAYAEHRFFNFSDDFTTWVIFYGPEGGE